MVLSVLAGHERRHEHGVVVREGLAAVDVCEDGDGVAGGFAGGGVGVVEGHVEYVRGGEVEVRGVPFLLGGEVGDAEAEVAELGDGCQ